MDGAAADDVTWLVNARSGSNQGATLLARLRDAGLAVHDLGEGGPHAVLAALAARARARRPVLVVAGGDGTVAWVLGCLDQYAWGPSCPRPALAVLPLGTGNDLARALGFGGGWDGRALPPPSLAALCSPARRPPALRALDRWRVYVAALDAASLEPVQAFHLTLNNYASFGCDAKVCFDFHALREAVPSLFSSRFINKLYYTAGGTVAFFEACRRRAAVRGSRVRRRSTWHWSAW